MYCNDNVKRQNTHACEKAYVFYSLNFVKIQPHTLFSLLSDGHSETKLMVLALMVDFSADDQVQADIQTFFEVSGDDAVVIDASTNSTLSKNVIITNARRRAALIPVPQEVARQHGFLAHLGAVRERQQTRGGDLPRGDGFVIRKPSGKTNARFVLATQKETFTT